MVSCLRIHPKRNEIRQTATLVRSLLTCNSSKALNRIYSNIKTYTNPNSNSNRYAGPKPNARIQILG